VARTLPDEGARVVAGARTVDSLQGIDGVIAGGIRNAESGTRFGTRFCQLGDPPIRTGVLASRLRARHTSAFVKPREREVIRA
jgi:hypothetical protein